ncbi:MAG: hypothetical protein AAGB26_01910 [Planctomycetota bacterium]
MSRHWIEQLSRDKGARGYGHPDNYKEMDRLIFERCVLYKVYVCNFEFEFPVLEEIEEYIDYFSQKTHPSSRVDIGAADHWEAQTRFSRLPLRLLNNHNRPLVLKALQSALDDFRKDKQK